MIRFINPNYHVILIHYPIALLGLGLLIEVLSFLGSTGSLLTAGRWMLLLGAFSALPAATSGIFAKYDVIHTLAAQDGNWVDLKTQAPLSALQWHFLNLHVLCSAIGAALATLAAMIWLGSPHWPQKLGFPTFIVMAASMGLMGVGAYNAGEMVYRTQFATRSQDQSDKLQKEWDVQTASAGGREKLQRRVEYYIDTLQMHVIGAGLVFALAAAGVGLSFQKSNQLRQTRRPPPPDEQDSPSAPAPCVPATLFWLLTAAGALLTIAVGWYIFAHDLSTPLWDVRSIFKSEIWEPFRKDSSSAVRPLAHLLLGGGLVVGALLFFAATRWNPRGRLLIGLLGVLMAAMVIAQIGVGVLMMYDTDGGPLLGFNGPSTTVAAAP